MDYLASASPPDLAADQWLFALSRHLSPASPSPKVLKSQVTRTPHAACEERLVYKEEVEGDEVLFEGKRMDNPDQRG
jgi:hypothetical protein